MSAVGENLTHPLNHRHFNYRMLGLPMRYYLYCTDNNHDLDVDLMFLNVVQFDCAQSQCMLSRALTARAEKSNTA